MSAATINEDRSLEAQFPCGAMIWHKVSGNKMMVIGHASYMDGSSMVIGNDGGSGSILLMPELITLDNPEFKSVQTS